MTDRKRILAVLRVMPRNHATISQLAMLTGGDRVAVYAAAARLAEEGVLRRSCTGHSMETGFKMRAPRPAKRGKPSAPQARPLLTTR
jgi:hypothetical protein